LAIPALVGMLIGLSSRLFGRVSCGVVRSLPGESAEDQQQRWPCCARPAAAASCGQSWRRPGVALLTDPWHGGADLVGIGFAITAAACWATYIMLTQRAGDEVTGSRRWRSRCRWLPSSLRSSPGPPVAGRLTWQIVLAGLGLALLLPVVPFSLELLALRG